MHSFAPVSPTSHIDTRSQDFYCDPSLSHVSYPIGGPSNYFDNTTAPVDGDSSHKRKSTDDPAESRPTIRQRQMTTPSTIVRSQPYITTSQGTREAPDIRIHAPSTHTGTLSHTPGSGPSTLQPTTILSSDQSRLSCMHSDAKETRPNDSATDLWHFVFGSQQQDEPEDLHSISHQTKFTTKPKTNLYPFIGCRICKWVLSIPSSNRAFTNVIHELERTGSGQCGRTVTAVISISVAIWLVNTGSSTWLKWERKAWNMQMPLSLGLWEKKVKLLTVLRLSPAQRQVSSVVLYNGFSTVARYAFFFHRETVS